MTIVSMDPGPGVAALQAWSGQVAAYGASNQTVVDKVPPELLHMIDPYWFVYSDPGQSSTFFVVIFYVN